MTSQTVRAITLALLGSSALAPAAFAKTQPPPPPETTSPDDDGTEIVVTAQKREENLQDVPVSIQAIGTRRLEQLNISNFEDYTKLLPSVSYQTSQPGSTVVYMRGVATGGDGNHSGSLPSVGTYLDEQPVTTIGGTLDVHVYDVARIESLSGPQGTLYGASSQAGTIRIISNKPELGVTAGRVDAEVNKVGHGDFGGSLEGMINLPISDRIAFRGIASYQRDGGFIDNVFGSRTYADSDSPDITIDNRDSVENNFNDLRTYGGRAALKIDLDDNWTITPSILHQNQKSSGVFFQDDDQGDLEVQRFMAEVGRDKFTQAALTVEGKVANFDLTYSGGYLKRPTFGTSDYTDYTDAYNNYYINLGYEGLLDYQNYVDDAGNTISPRQHITGTNDFRKMSHEVRLVTPAESRIRLLLGAFYQRQTNDIYQNYQVDNLASSLSVPGYPGTIWLTKQERIDKDYALFGEASIDLASKFTITGGGRLFKYDNSLFGFAGFGPGNPGGFSSGVRRCLTVNGLQSRRDRLSPLATGGVSGTPCTNVGNVVDGELVPRRSKGNGFTHKVNAQYKPSDDVMLYATWSRGFRPGGINRQPDAPAYDPDYLTNYEFGWKTSFGPVRWNGAIYRQLWKSFQFSFLGENSLTVIQNGRDARINGIESDVSYSRGGLSLTAAAAYTDAKTKQNICNFSEGNSACNGLDDGGDDDFIVAPKGTRLPVTPKFKASATARYAWPMWAGRAHVQSSLAYRGPATNDIRQDIGGGFNPNDNVPKLKGYTLVDAAVGYDWSEYLVEAFVSNLFDERTEQTRFVSCNATYCFRPHTVIGRPRTLGIRVGAKF